MKNKDSSGMYKLLQPVKEKLKHRELDRKIKKDFGGMTSREWQEYVKNMDDKERDNLREKLGPALLDTYEKHKFVRSLRSNLIDRVAQKVQQTNLIKKIKDNESITETYEALKKDKEGLDAFLKELLLTVDPKKVQYLKDNDLESHLDPTKQILFTPKGVAYVRTLLTKMRKKYDKLVKLYKRA